MPMEVPYKASISGILSDLAIESDCTDLARHSTLKEAQRLESQGLKVTGWIKNMANAEKVVSKRSGLNILTVSGTWRSPGRAGSCQGVLEVCQ